MNLFKDFDKTIKEIEISFDYESSKNNMMKLFNFIDFDFFCKEPEKIFALHRILAKRPDLIDIAIRFTVQVNLFSGSIINFGNEYHKSILDKRPVGCFGLTEKKAGVLSGLIVNTSFNFLENENKFIINTEKEEYNKNWISQGLTSEYCVLFARGNYKENKNTIFPFLIRLRDENNEIYDSISIRDMGKKSVANNLDNTEISFCNHKIDENCIMNNINSDGKISFLDISNRLLTGRLILAQCSIIGCKTIFDQMFEYLVNKKIPNTNYSIYSLPKIKKLFDNFYKEYELLEKYCKNIECNLCNQIKICYYQDKKIKYDNKLIKQINIAKIKCTESACNYISKLQINVGSICLTNSPGNLDSFLTFKFAEGDTNILRQKIVSDEIIKLYKKNNSIPNPFKIIEYHKLYILFMKILLTKKIYLNNLWVDNQNYIKGISDEIINKELKSFELINFSKL